MMPRFVPIGVSLDITGWMGRNKVDIIKSLLKIPCGIFFYQER